MKRTYRRTMLETAGADSVWMKAVDKHLVAQIEIVPIVPGDGGHDMIIEHWRTVEDKMRDLAEEADKDAGTQAIRNEAEDRRSAREDDRESARGLGNGELLASVKAWANILKGRTPPDDQEDWGAFDELFERYAKAFCPRFAR